MERGKKTTEADQGKIETTFRAPTRYHDEWKSSSIDDKQCIQAEDKSSLSQVITEATPLDMDHLQKPASSSCGRIFPSASPPRGRWRDGFCDWHKKCVPSCLMGSIFHCVLLGQVAQRVQYCLRYKEVVSLTLGLWMFSCFLYATLPRNAIFGGLSNLAYFLLSVFILYQLRGRARTQFSIPGDLRSDLFASLCCSFCTLTQLARHLFDHPREPWEDEEEDLWIEDGHPIR